jgi:ribosomal protein L29
MQENYKLNESNKTSKDYNKELNKKNKLLTKYRLSDATEHNKLREEINKLKGEIADYKYKLNKNI